MSQDNSAQKAYWNDKAGPSWVAAQERLDAMLAPLSEKALAKAAVKVGERVLDIGCGCGATTIALAEAGAVAVGVDLSEPMLEHARLRAKHVNNIEFSVEDAVLYQASERFDVLFSRFGVMFFADPVEAFANLHKQLNASGRLAFICWQAPQHNPWMAIPGKAVAEFLPPMDPPPQPTDPGPFAFADPDYLKSTLAQAGFKQIELESIEAGMYLGSSLDEVMEYQKFVGPVARVVSELEGEIQEQAVAAARSAFAEHLTDSGITLPGRVWLVSARA